MKLWCLVPLEENSPHPCVCYPEKARTGHSGKVGLLGREGLAGISAKNGRGGVTNPPSSLRV